MRTGKTIICLSVSVLSATARIGLVPHLLCSHLALMGFRRTCATTITTSFGLRPPPYMTTCAVAAAACGPGAKMSLAYATGPFSVPHGPAGAPRTTGGQILYGALQPPPQKSPWSSLKSAPTRCEPIPAFPLLPEPPICTPSAFVTGATSRCEPIPAFPLLPETPTCLAWPSAASTSARCEPFSPNRLTPASCAQAPGPTLWQQAPGNRQPPAMLLC